MKMQVMGGKMIFNKLDNKLNGEEYAMVKTLLWMDMLNDRMKPTKWTLTKAKGTKVDFDTINSQEDYDKGIEELEVFIIDINKRYETEIEISGKPVKMGPSC